LHISICKDTKHVYMDELVSKTFHDVLNVIFTKADETTQVLYCVILSELGCTLSSGLNDIDPFHDYKPVEVSK